MVAIWVLSPISARKNATSVAPNAPNPPTRSLLSSYLSGNNAQPATARNEIPRIHRIQSPVRKRPNIVPASPAAA